MVDAGLRVQAIREELLCVRTSAEQTRAQLQAALAESRTMQEAIGQLRHDADALAVAWAAQHPPSRREFTGVPEVAPSSSGSGSAATAHSAAPAAEAAATSPGSAGPVAPAAATASGRGDPAAVEAEPPRVKRRLS